MTQNVQQRDVTVYASGIILAIWVVLTFLDAETHYFMAPLLAAGAFPVMMRIKNGKQQTAGAVGAALGGLIPVLMMTGLLSAAGRLKGPPLFDWGGPASEALIFAVAGAVIGGLVALAPSPARK